MHVIKERGNWCSFVAYDEKAGGDWPILFYQGTSEYYCGLDEQWYSLEDAARIVAALTEILNNHGHTMEVGN
jgi:hypothetical protein